MFSFWQIFSHSFLSPALLFQQLEAAAARAAEEEKKRLQTQVELQDRFSLELEREKMVSSARGFFAVIPHSEHRVQQWLSSQAVITERIPQILQEAEECNLRCVY